MAKIKDEDNFDDLNFDDLGDFDDFGSFEDGEASVGKRNVFTRLIGGFKDGVKASFTDPKNHRAVIKEALPKGYSRIYDAGEFAAESVGDLMSEARKGYGQQRDEIKKAMNTILPSIGESASSTRLARTLKTWSSDIRSPQNSMEDVDPEQAFLATELSDTFGTPNEAAVGDRSSSEDKESKNKRVSETAQRKLLEHASRTSQILNDRVSAAQMNAMVHHLSGSHFELQKLTAYQDQVTSQYQRKSLEIKYRHYFVARKSLDILMQTLDLNKASYDKIITNTSLPDAVKIHTSEHAQQILREKFLGSAIEPARATLGNIGSKIMQKSKTKLQEFFKDLGANLVQMNDAAATAFGDDSGIDIMRDILGDNIGQAAGSWGMKKLAGKASGFLGENKKLSRLGLAGQTALENGGRIFQSMLRNDTGIAPLEWLKGTGFLDEFAYRRDETIRKDASSMLDDQAMWDQKSRKALTEVIPGLLEKSNLYTSSILAFMRGDPAPSLERYNYASGLFESDDVIRSRIEKDVFGQASNKDTAQSIRNFAGEFEQKRKLSPEAKAALMKHSMNESLNGGSLNLEAYARGEKRWSTDDKLNDEIQKAFMESIYHDYQEGVDDNEQGGFVGDLNRTYRRGEGIASRAKLMKSFQEISNNQGVLNKESMLRHMNVAGGNTAIEMGFAKQEGNNIVMNREKLDDNIVKIALQMDVGYLTSTVFDLEENENSLGHSVNSNVKKLITAMDKRYDGKLNPTDVLKIRTVYSLIKDNVFAGSNATLINKTDLDTSEKKKLLDAFSKKLFEWMNTSDHNTMESVAQDYFKERLDLITSSLGTSKITAPLRDFLNDPLQIDPGAWGKSKKKVLEGLREAGLDEEILKQLESSIKDVKDATGRTVDMKLAELTGTKTYGDAANFLNRMSDKGLNWLTKSLRDPNHPPDPVLDPNSMFTKIGKTADHLSKHSKVGRWLYTKFLDLDSTVNNSYENIKDNQGLKKEVDKYAANANGEVDWYEDRDPKKIRSILGAGSGSVASPMNPNFKPNAQGTQEQTTIIETAAEAVTDIFKSLAEKMDQFSRKGNTATTMSWSNQKPLFNPAKVDGNSVAKITGINADIEIHHTGGIAGNGNLFSHAERHHTGGVAGANIQIIPDEKDLGYLYAFLPDGRNIKIYDHRLAKKGVRVSKADFKGAINRAKSEVIKKYLGKASTVSTPTVTDLNLKGNEVPAVLEKGEEVVTAKDPRHQDNIEETIKTLRNEGDNTYLEGILENSIITNELLTLISEGSGVGGQPGLIRKTFTKIGNGAKWAKGKVGSGIKSIHGGVSSLWNKFDLKGLIGNLNVGNTAKWVAGKGVDAAKWGAGKGVDAAKWGADKAWKGGKWAFGKGEKIVESATELGKRLKDKIPSLDEIKKFGGVVIDNTLVPAKDFIAAKYTASAEWWKENHPKFKLDFSEFWTSFKEKFKDWKPGQWAKDKLSSAKSMAGMGWNTAKDLVGGVFQGPAKLKRWIGGKVRSGLNMLKGFMSGGMWAAMKYREVDSITDEVSGLRQVYLGIVDLQSIIMDRLGKPKSRWNDKDGDGKRDASGRFIKRDEVKVDKDGNPVPGQEKKTDGLLSNIFGSSMIGLAIKALIGGIVGETMSNLLGVDLGLVGNTLVGMATVGGGIWAAKKAIGYGAGKAGDLAKKGLGKVFGRKGRGANQTADAVGDMLGGGGCGCCCNDDGDSFGDMGDDDRRKKKRGRKGRKGRSRGGRNNRTANRGRTSRVPTGGAGTRVPTGAAAVAAESAAARGAGSGFGNSAARLLSGPGGAMAARAGGLAAVGMGGYQLYQTLNDDSISTDQKVEDSSSVIGGTAGALAGASAGAAIGSIVPVAGTLVGGLVGGAAGYFLGSGGGKLIGKGINAVRNSSLYNLAAEPVGMALAGVPIFGAMKLAGSLWGAFDKDKNPLMTFRFAQYGFDIDKDKYGKALMGLEADLLKDAKAVAGKTPTINPKRPMEEYFEMFAVDPTNEAEKTEWLQWFHYRFKPIFLSHLSEWNRIMKNTKLHDGDDKIGKTAAVEYLKNVHYKNSERAPYILTKNPFGDEKGKLLDSSDVNKAYNKAVKAVGSLPERPMADAEKAAAGIKDTGNKAALAKEEVEAKKAEEIAKQEEEGGFWNSLKKAASLSPVGMAYKAAANIGNAIGDGARALAEKTGNFFSDLGDGLSNSIAHMTGDQKEWQMRVYKAFKNAGFSEQQARILTAEIGRENSYAPKYLFGGHSDPHKGANLGMLSWQGDRRPKLVGFLRQAGVLNKAGDIIHGQAALDAQAKFIMWELRNTHSKVGSKFLSNPNISYKDGAWMIGKDYILWRITDPKYAADGIKNRDGFYNMLLKQLGAKDGDAAKAGTTSTNKAPPPLLARPGVAASNMPAPIQKQAAGMVAGANAAVAAIGTKANPSKTNSPPPLLARPGVNTAPASTGSAKDWDADKMVATLIKNAGSKSKGQCAKYVRLALQAGDLKKQFKGSLASAYMYVEALPKLGWGRIGTPQTVKPQKGDICVFPRYGSPGTDGYKHGHICMYTGKQWISDFYQKTAFPNSKNQSLAGHVFRAGSIHDSGKAYGSSIAAGEIDESGNPKEMVPNMDAPEGIRTGTTSTGYSFSYDGKATSKTTFSENDQLEKLKSLGSGKETNTKSGSELEKIAGYGVGTGINKAAITGAPSTNKVAEDTKADLKAVKEAENATVATTAKQAETQKVEQANQTARMNRTNKVATDSQTEMVNIMRESLTVSKQMSQTLKEINRNIQLMGNNSGKSLRGEEAKAPAKLTSRPATPPETAPVSMRI